MADGKIVIAVDVDGKQVSVLNKNLDQLEGKSSKAGASIKNMAVSMGLVKVAGAAFNVLKNSLDSAISRFDTMQKFPKVMKALGFSAKESQKSIDKLSDGIDGLPTKLDDVVASTQQMTAITGDLDKSTDTVLALNNAFLASGASTDDASRGMQQFNQMLSTGTVDLESWKTLQETMPLALQKTAEAMGYVGKSAQRDLYAALKDGTVTFDQFNEKLIELGTGTGMLADLAKENSLGIATSFGNLRNAVAKNVANIITKFDEIVQKLSGKTIAQNIDGIKTLINDLGNAIVNAMDSIIPALEMFSKAINNESLANSGAFLWIRDAVKLISFDLQNLSLQVQDRLGSIKEVFQNVLQGIQPIVTKISAIISGWAIAISGVLSYAIPLALDVLIAAFDGFQQFVLPVLDTLVDKVWDISSSITEAILNYVVPALQGIIDWVSQNQSLVQNFGKLLGALAIGFATFKTLSTIIPVITTVGTAIRGLVTAFSMIKSAAGALTLLKFGFSTLVTAVGGPITIVIAAVSALVAGIIYLWQTNEQFRTKVIEIWTAILEFLQPILTSISEFIMSVWGSLVAWWNENQQLILSTVQTVWGAIQVAFSIALGAIQLIVTIALTAIQSFWNTWGSTIMALVQVVWASVQAIFQSTLSTIMAVVTGVMNQIQTIINTVMGVIQGIIKVITGAIKGDWSQVWEGIKQIVVTVFNGIKNTISNVLETAKSIVSGKIDAMKSFFKSIGDIDLFQIGKNVIQGLIDGVGSMVNAVKNKISEVAGGIKDKITGALGIHSPSRWMRDQVGRFIPQGIAVGIDKDADTPLKSMKRLSANLMNLTPETALGTNRIGMSSSGSQIINNNYQQAVTSNPMIGTSFEIPVTIEMSNQKVGKAVAKFSWEEIQKMQRRQKRSQEGIT